MRWLGWIAGNWFHEKWTAEWKWASAIGLLQAVEICCIRTERRRDRLRTVVIGWCRFFGIFPFCRLAGGIECETANLLKISQWLDASHLAQTIARARKCTLLFYYRAMLYADRGIATASRRRLSVCPWRGGIVITQLEIFKNNLTVSLIALGIRSLQIPIWRIYSTCKGNTPKF